MPPHQRRTVEREASSTNPYASATRWRHQESPAYWRHANPDNARALDASSASAAQDPNRAAAAAAANIGIDSVAMMDSDPQVPSTLDPTGVAVLNGAGLDAPTIGDIVCGPLLNFRRMESDEAHYSVLVVTKGGGKEPGPVPTMLLRRLGQTVGPHSPDTAAYGNANKTHDHMNGNAVNGSGSGGEDSRAHGVAVARTVGSADVKALCLYSDPRNTFWRFNIVVGLEDEEVQWEYSLPNLRLLSTSKPRRNSFFVPARQESMRVMFYSCNGFSVGTDEAAWSGPALWNDVVRRHRDAPFHVMIGGGDQIYMDGIRVDGPLRPWTEIRNPQKRQQFPFTEKLREACDNYYLNRYIHWYNTEPFALANGQIPQVSLWDDHDIIDGFGSYTDHFMKCPVFRGLGGVAQKYYFLFQFHTSPPLVTFTSDRDPARDRAYLEYTYVHARIDEPNFIVGTKPGPYVAGYSYNIFARLGARIALVGIDARTERTRHQVNHPETYDQIFDRLNKELKDAKASGRPFKHLLVLLGIPIAYPRLTWLENIFSSPVIGPIKFLNKRFGVAGGLFNRFDGSVDLLDDLDDHYTARTHKRERSWLIERMQVLCAEHSVRITILGGDVHLAALGRFYSNPKLNTPTENDHRYMANIISSAIVNKPPPRAIADLLARRNKIHHLNHDTDETLLKIFDKDPGNANKTAAHNHVTMPSRNYAIITENSPHNLDPAPPLSPFSQAATATPPNGPLSPSLASPPSTPSPAGANGSAHLQQTSFTTEVTTIMPVKPDGGPRDCRTALHAGELNAGTQHKAASAAHGKARDGSLDVCIRVEINRRNPAGHTDGYGLTIPTLVYNGPVPPPISRGKYSSIGL